MITSSSNASNPPKITEEKPPEKNAAKDTLNSPDLDASGRPTRRAITTAAQAWQIAKKLKTAAQKSRIGRNAELASRYGGSAPFDAKALQRANQTWRNNFSTLFLSSIIDRVRPVFSDNIQKSKVLTLSALPDTYKDASKKSDSFREIITKTIRSWASWDDFLSLVTQEDVLIGYATPAWIDDDWRIRMFRSDEIFFPDGTGQDADKVQYFAVEQSLLVHEFIDIIDDKKAATRAGWDIENCAAIINEQFSATGSEKGNSAISAEDRIREGGIASSYQDEAKTIDLFHVIVREYDGGVDIWTGDWKSGKKLRYRKKLHSGMEDATVLITMQSGNGKLYGSRGLGRSLVNISTAIERGRCYAMDQRHLAGMLVISVDEAAINTMQASVRHPFIVLPKGVEISANSIEYNAEGSMAMDGWFVNMAESIAGAFIPSQTQETSNSPTTKIADAQKVIREEAVKQGVLSRFYRQFAKLIEGKQRKICSTRNLREAVRIRSDRDSKQKAGIVVLARKVMEWLGDLVKDRQSAAESAIADPEAVSAIVEMLDAGLSLEEIAVLALSPATETLARESGDNDNATIQWLQIAAQTPFIDQKEALIMGGEVSGVSPDRISRIMLPESNDPNIEAEQTRAQIDEWHLMLEGEQIPVSGRDNHLIHRKVLSEKIMPLIQALATNPAGTTPELIATAQAAVAHLGQHLTMDASIKPDEMKKAMTALQGLDKAVQVADQAMQKMAAEQGANPGQSPVPIPGAPQDAPSPEQGAQDVDMIKHGSEVALRAKEAGQEDQRIALEQSQFEHSRAMDVANHALQASKLQIEAMKAGASAPMGAPGA